jgi:hypothetical protein
MSINFNSPILDKRTKIIDEWYDIMVSSLFNGETNYILHEKDHFINPSGIILREALSDIFAFFFEKVNIDDISVSLEKFIKLLAVNKNGVENVLGTFFTLRDKIIENWRSLSFSNNVNEELSTIQSYFDKLILRVFTFYLTAREKIYEIRVNEIKRLTFSLLRNKGLIEKIPEFSEGNLKPHEL